MNQLHIFTKVVVGGCSKMMVKNVIGGGTQNLEYRVENKIDKRYGSSLKF